MSCAISIGSALLVATLRAQTPGIAWRVPEELNAEDRQAILDLARRTGIRDPQSLTVPMGSACGLVEVESRPVVGGNSVLSDILMVRRVIAPGCRQLAPGQRFQQERNWIAPLFASNPRKRQRWRIRDGDWHVDVELEAGVPYGDAVTVVHAIRGKQLVDRRPPSREKSSEIRSIDPSAIRWVRTGRNMDSRRVPIPREYEVMTGETWGDWLTVRIRDGLVELHNHGQWTP
jgi:hypothetical protein